MHGKNRATDPERTRRPAERSCPVDGRTRCPCRLRCVGSRQETSGKGPGSTTQETRTAHRHTDRVRPVHRSDAVAGAARPRARLRAGQPGNGTRARGALAELEVLRGAGRQSRRFHGSHREGPQLRALVQGHASPGTGRRLRTRRSRTHRAAALPRPHRLGPGHEHRAASRLGPGRLGTLQGLTAPPGLSHRGMEARRAVESHVRGLPRKPPEAEQANQPDPQHHHPATGQGLRTDRGHADRPVEHHAVPDAVHRTHGPGRNSGQRPAIPGRSASPPPCTGCPGKRRRGNPGQDRYPLPQRRFTYQPAAAKGRGPSTASRCPRRTSVGSASFWRAPRQPA